MPANVDMTGVFLPMTTPFDQSGNLDMNNVTKNIQHMNKYDFKGLVVASKSGESHYLSDEERIKLVQTAKQSLKSGRVLIAGAGHHGTYETVKLCNQLAQAGAQAALVHAPRSFHDRQKNECALLHFRQVADQCKVPVIIYNIPTFTGTDLDTQTIISLAAHQNIVGLCDTSENFNRIREIVNATKSQNFKVWAGSAHLINEYVQAGAAGVMAALANVMPQEIVQIYTHASSGKQTEAQQVQQRLLRLSQSMKRIYGPAGLKYLMDKQQGQCYGGPVRAPEVPLTNEERQAVDGEYRQASSN